MSKSGSGASGTVIMLIRSISGNSMWYKVQPQGWRSPVLVWLPAGERDVDVRYAIKYTWTRTTVIKEPVR